MQSLTSFQYRVNSQSCLQPNDGSPGLTRAHARERLLDLVQPDGMIERHLRPLLGAFKA